MIRQASATIAAMILCACATSDPGCDEFIGPTIPLWERYVAEHRIYPPDQTLSNLATKYAPKLTLSSDNASDGPIDFDGYLAEAVLLDKSGRTLANSQDLRSTLNQMPPIEQCQTYLDGPESIPSPTQAPIYVQAWRDRAPGAKAAGDSPWLYLKFNLAFNWSGLATERSWVSEIGSVLAGGNSDHWHRFDIHTAAIIGFNSDLVPQTVTLMQHNYQRTFLYEEVADTHGILHLVAAERSNELYIDDGRTTPEQHRVITFMDKSWSWILGLGKAPWMWALDFCRGRNAGGHSRDLSPVWIEPDHPLARFAGLLAPSDRILGLYVGRDGPPGFDFFNMSAVNNLPDTVAIGYWRKDAKEQWEHVRPLLGPYFLTDWKKITSILGNDLRNDLSRTAPNN